MKLTTPTTPLNATPPPNWVPASCSLPTAEQPLRVAEFDDLFTRHARTVHRADARHLLVTIDQQAQPLAEDLAARETACCSLFTFTFADPAAGAGAGQVVMTIGVPAEHAEVLDALQARITHLAESRPV